MDILIGLLTASLLAVVPMLLYAVLLWWFDRYEKEPVGLILAAFLWGAIPAVIFSFVAQLVLDLPLSVLVQPGLGSDLLSASLIAPLTEEPFKGVALLLLLLFFRQEIDSPLDGILYGGLVGFGFATTENALYFLGAFGTGGVSGALELAFYRAVLFGLNHALFTGCTGLGFALARTSPRWSVKIAGPLLGLGAGIILHALHNTGAALARSTCLPLLISLASDWGGVTALVAVLIWTSIREQAQIVRYLRDETSTGAIGPQDYFVIQSYWRRVSHRTQALLRGNLSRWWLLGRYHRLATELAFAKHRLAAFGAEQDTIQRVERLRRQLYELRKQL